MDHSKISSMRDISPSSMPEESGWTYYLDDFSSNLDEDGSFCSGFDVSPSLVSDAATGRTRLDVPGGRAQGVSSGCSTMDDLPKKLRMIKKTRAEEIHRDDSLEDTASSPISSPKVSDLVQINQMDVKSSQDYVYSSFVMGKAGSTFGDQNLISTLEEEETMNLKLMNGKINELRSKGLCLVPMSMLFKCNGN